MTLWIGNEVWEYNEVINVKKHNKNKKQPC